MTEAALEERALTRLSGAANTFVGLLAQMSTHFNNADIQTQLIMDRFFGEFKIYIMTALNLCFKSKWVWMKSSN